MIGKNEQPEKPKPHVISVGQEPTPDWLKSAQFISMEQLKAGGMIILRTSGPGIPQKLFAQFHDTVKKLGFRGAIAILNKDQTIEDLSEEAQRTIYQALAKKFEKDKQDGAGS